MKKLPFTLIFIAVWTAIVLAVSASDDFNRADSGTLGANWTATQNNMGIVSNEARPQTNGVYNFNYYSGSSFANDHYSQGVYRSHGGAGMTLQVRHKAGGDLYMVNLSDSTGLKVFKYVSGSFTEVGDTSSSVASAYDGHTIKLEATGTGPTSLKVYDNGAQLGSTFTDGDSALQSGGAPGIGGSASDGGWDDWAGADVGGGGGGATNCNGLLLGVGKCGEFVGLFVNRLFHVGH